MNSTGTVCLPASSHPVFCGSVDRNFGVLIGNSATDTDGRVPDERESKKSLAGDGSRVLGRKNPCAWNRLCMAKPRVTESTRDLELSVVARL
jgi:hypothetical protein